MEQRFSVAARRFRDRSRVLLSATLAVGATAGCPEQLSGARPPPIPSPDVACTAAQQADDSVAKCCLVITEPQTQRACTSEELASSRRCCPK